MRCVSFLLILSMVLSACGEEEAPSATAPPMESDADWSAPTSLTAQDVLARVRKQVVSGAALSGHQWQQDLEAVADLLWPDGSDAVRRHMQLLQVAGDAGRAFARDPDEVERWREQQPEDLEIYESFLRSSEVDPEVYRRWVESDGARLLRAKADRLQRHFKR